MTLIAGSCRGLWQTEVQATGLCLHQAEKQLTKEAARLGKEVPRKQHEPTHAGSQDDGAGSEHSPQRAQPPLENAFTDMQLIWKQRREEQARKQAANG